MQKLQFEPRNKLEQLLQDNYGLVVNQALLFKPKNNLILEEYIQIGITAFLKAAGNFDAEKGKFSTYISNCIHNAIFDFVKKNNKVQIVDISENYVDSYNRQSIDEFLPKNLTMAETKIIEMKLSNYTKQEIIEILALDINEFNILFKSIKKKIKEANEN